MTQARRTIICFDLGGVVVRICRTWREACENAGIEYRAIDPAHEPGILKTWRDITDEHQRGRIVGAEYFRRIARATSDLYSPLEVEALHRAWVMDDYPGVGPLIQELNAIENITTACLSNTNATHWEALTESTGASPAIREISVKLVSHVIGAIKPEHAAFEALERATGSAPENIVLFDDTPENVEAARGLGWNATAIDHEGDTARQMRDALGCAGMLA